MPLLGLCAHRGRGIAVAPPNQPSIPPKPCPWRRVRLRFRQPMQTHHVRALSSPLPRLSLPVPSGVRGALTCPVPAQGTSCPPLSSPPAPQLRDGEKLSRAFSRLALSVGTRGRAGRCGPSSSFPSRPSSSGPPFGMCGRHGPAPAAPHPAPGASQTPGAGAWRAQLRGGMGRTGAIGGTGVGEESGLGRGDPMGPCSGGRFAVGTFTHALSAGDTRGPLCPNTQVMGRRL